MKKNQVYVGTAGWSYPDWENIVYPSARTVDRLQTVVRYLDCVEVDSSFYRPPSPQMAENWLKKLQDQPNFYFLAKAWQRFTHDRSAIWTRSEFELFTAGLAPLRDAGRLEGLLFQFPWSFRKDAENLDWLNTITDWFSDWPVVVELRHDSWLGDEVLNVLRSHAITFCNIDQPSLRHCLPPTSHATSKTGYYRLHGRNAHNWFRQEQEIYGGRYDYLYSASELDELLPHIQRVAKQATKTFVIFNNHKDGKAFANALQVKARLSPGATILAPVSVRAKFPALSDCTTPDGAEQLPLV